MTQVTTKAGAALLDWFGGPMRDEHSLVELIVEVEREARGDSVTPEATFFVNPAERAAGVEGLVALFARNEGDAELIREVCRSLVTPEASVGERLRGEALCRCAYFDADSDGRCRRCGHDASFHYEADEETDGCNTPIAATPAASDGSLDVLREIVEAMGNRTLVLDDDGATVRLIQFGEGESLNSVTGKPLGPNEFSVSGSEVSTDPLVRAFARAIEVVGPSAISVRRGLPEGAEPVNDAARR